MPGAQGEVLLVYSAAAGTPSATGLVLLGAPAATPPRAELQSGGA